MSTDIKKQSKTVLTSMAGSLPSVILSSKIRKKILQHRNTNTSDMFVKHYDNSPKPEVMGVIEAYVVSYALFNDGLIWDNKELIEQMRADLEEIKQEKKFYMKDAGVSIVDDIYTLDFVEGPNHSLIHASFAPEYAKKQMRIVAEEFDLKPAKTLVSLLQKIKNHFGFA